MTHSTRHAPHRSALRPRRTAALLGLLLAAALLLAAGCASQQETSLSALHYFQRGNAAYQAEDFPRAIEHFLKALEFDDQAPDIHYNLGLAYYRVEAWREAVAEFQSAVRLDPQFADAYLNLALSYDKLYNAPAAHQAYNRYRALSLHTGQPETAPATAARTQTSVPAGAPPPGSLGRSSDSGPAPVSSLPRLGGGTVGGAAGGATAGGGNIGARGANGGATGGAERQAPRRFQPVGNGTGNPAGDTPNDAPNPFEGNGKWWTQDTAIQSR